MSNLLENDFKPENQSIPTRNDQASVTIKRISRLSDGSKTFDPMDSTQHEAKAKQTTSVSSMSYVTESSSTSTQHHHTERKYSVSNKRIFY